MRHSWLPTRSFDPRRRAALWAALPVLIGLCEAARAECGVPSPDYAARRTVTVAGQTVAMRVNVAGSTIREETDLGDGVRVTIRAPGRPIVAFDPRAGTGIEVPAPRGNQLPTRSIDEVAPDGRRVRVQQVESRGRWLETSRITCRKDGVMLRQTFVSVGAQGQELSGTVAQDDITINPQPASLFEIPADIQITRPDRK